MPARQRLAGVPFDIVSLNEFDAAIRARTVKDALEYVVTPNVDHVVRANEANLFGLYEKAWRSVCDSRILARVAWLVGIRFPDVITGSDLTKRLLFEMLDPGDQITIIGTEARFIDLLKEKLPGIEVRHMNPPMGFIKDAAEVNKVVDFIVRNPARFIFLAIGSPQQEIVAINLKTAGAHGTAFCVGASILFLVGAERRAPVVVQRLGFEWLFRLIQNPRRLWRRYFFECPKIFLLLLRQRMSEE